MNLQLAGKKALITGSSRGIGKAVARQLAQEGVNCVISAIDEEKLKQTARELNQGTGSALYPVPGSEIYPVLADLRDPDSILNLVEKAAELLGGIDILVNYGTDVIVGEPEKDDLITDDFNGIIRAVAPYMMKNNWGRIINISGIANQNVGSISASTGTDNEDVIQLTKSSSVELGKYGITVNAVYPGVIEMNSTGSLVNAEDIANVVTFLSSPLSVSITGDVIDASGGSNTTVHYRNNKKTLKI